MKFLPLVAVATFAVPLPAGPPNVQKWIKINEVEYPVPFGMHPNDYREQLARAGIAMVNVHPLPTSMAYPRPPITPAVQSTATRQQQAASVTYQQPAIQTFYNEAYQYAVPTARPVEQAQVFYGYNNNQAWERSPMWVTNNNPSGTRQWVKLREGTEPIEVPQGAEPQSYLESIRHAKLRYLSEVSTVEGVALREMRRKKANQGDVVSSESTSKASHEWWAPKGLAEDDAGYQKIPATPDENLLGRYVLDSGSTGVQRPSSKSGLFNSHSGVRPNGPPIFVGGRWAHPPNFDSSNQSGKVLQLRARWPAASQISPF